MASFLIATERNFMNSVQVEDILSSLVVVVIIGTILTVVVRGIMLLFCRNKEWVRHRTTVIAIVCLAIALLVRLLNS